MKRRFIDALSDERCAWTVTLRDGSTAQCGRSKTAGDLCTQHAKMRAAWHCEYCGGNDENPPDHTVDCSRPRDLQGAVTEQNHYRTIQREGAKWRPYCSCGWKGRLSKNTDQAGGQYATHIARLSTATDLAAARGVTRLDGQTK